MSNSTAALGVWLWAMRLGAYINVDVRYSFHPVAELACGDGRSRSSTASSTSFSSRSSAKRRGSRGTEVKMNMIQTDELGFRPVLTTATDIPAGTILLRIPQHLCITKYFSPSMHSEMAAALAGGNMPAHLQTVILLMMEYTARDASPLKPWLDEMPDTFHNPMCWTEKERKELVGTTCEDDDEVKNLEETFESQIYPQLLAAGIEKYLCNISEFKKFSAFVHHNAFHFPTFDSTVPYMIPIADMIQRTNEDPNVYLELRDTEVVVSAAKALRANEILKRSEGPFSTAQMVQRYGMIGDTSRNDVAILTKDDLKSFVKNNKSIFEGVENAEKRLEEIEKAIPPISLDSIHISEHDLVPESVMVMAQLLALEDEEFERQKHDINSLGSCFYDEDMTLLRVYGIIAAIAQSKLTSFRGSIRNDNHIIQNFIQSKQATSHGLHRALAAGVRLSERRVLKTLLSELNSSMADITEGFGSISGEPDDSELSGLNMASISGKIVKKTTKGKEKDSHGRDEHNSQRTGKSLSKERSLSKEGSSSGSDQEAHTILYSMSSGDAQIITGQKRRRTVDQGSSSSSSSLREARHLSIGSDLD
eukprot:Clim_evm153s147 gene=Clim_evmTU153s147